jgi:tetratricopeptide (TPR) repeat protein
MDWFRKTDWTDQDRDEFFARLERVQKGNRAQYLRIQAAILLSVKKEKQVRGSVALLQLLPHEYPQPQEVALANQLLGDGYQFLKQYDDAVACYRQALEQQVRFPQVLSPAHLSFARLVAEHHRRDEYNEALAALSKWSQPSDFPVMTFVACGAGALIYLDMGLKPEALQWARQALAAAEKTHSGFRNHPTLGLVEDEYHSLLTKLKSLVNAYTPGSGG